MPCVNCIEIFHRYEFNQLEVEAHAMKIGIIVCDGNEKWISCIETICNRFDFNSIPNCVIQE